LSGRIIGLYKFLCVLRVGLAQFVGNSFSPQRSRRNRKARKEKHFTMIRKLKSGDYRLYSRKKDAKTGKRRNLGTFKTRKAAESHERAVQFFKRH
jgi:hypothetical protein